MDWQKDGTWWKAMGKQGTFWLRRMRGVWWAWYKPNSDRPKIWLLSSTNLTETKRRCECNHRWETD